jgi:hypothetical protein
VEYASACLFALSSRSPFGNRDTPRRPILV